MRTTFLKGVVLGAVVSGVTLVSSVALAGTGVGGVFNLGQANSVNASTTLTGSTKGAQLQVTNTNAGAKAAGVGINVAAGAPPLRVNSSTQVANLNASYVGGIAATGFVQGAASVHGWRLSVPSTGLSGLGGVGSFGGMNAYCETGGFTWAGVTFDTAENLEAFWPNLSYGSYSTGSTFTIAPDETIGYATVQLVSATGIATVSITYETTVDGCNFYVQVIESNG